jgi:hypothetical protein
MGNGPNEELRSVRDAMQELNPMADALELAIQRSSSCARTTACGLSCFRWRLSAGCGCGTLPPELPFPAKRTAPVAGVRGPGSHRRGRDPLADGGSELL